ncbi:gamma-tubulin complex component 2-like protein [Leptotrombidium deliense]|uniref:Gamma-tubulin complex component n=1 Tax=Leptotrombidium deliense TaxID=299467 RepID=A0A443SQN7_9ACAR|nr:gamma-tubulin complex component 2-like protein [Leptotrombidium deliense]
MSEFSVAHDVHRLMALLGVEESVENGVTEEQISERFESSLNQNCKKGSKTQFVQKLQTHSNSEFTRQYEDLKARNVMETDPLVSVLARISENPDIRYFLRLHKATKDKRNLLTDSPSERVSRTSSKLSILRPSSVYLESEETNGHRDASSALSLDIPPIGESSANDERKSAKSETRYRSARSRSSSKSCKSRIDWSFLTYDFAPNDYSTDFPVKPLSRLSVSEQETALIDDLLYILVGIEGHYIRLNSVAGGKSTILVDESCDKLLKTLVDRITAICPLYSNVVFFMEEGGNGLVNQALIASIRNFIREYFSLICELERCHKRGELSLQKIWYLLQHILSNMEILHSVCVRIRQGNCIGGAVLSILHEKTIASTGNMKASQFITKVTADTAKPYLNILDKWITEGCIDDPHKEFFIEDYGCSKEEDLAIDCYDDSFWENRYSILSSRMPVFLSRFADKILKTGKYLSVIKQCGKELSDVPFLGEPLSYTVEDRVYAEKIDAAYTFASKQLLHLLLDECKLVSHLNSIKNYFFMDRGDFIVQFMDMAEDELIKEIDNIIPTRLESLLELAVRTSVLHTNPHNDNLGIELLDTSVLNQLSAIMSKGSEGPSIDDYLSMSDPTVLRGYEALAFKYKVEWPLSLILHRESLGCYQLLFRHMFYCRFVERQLEIVWKVNKTAKSQTLKNLNNYAEAFCLRQKMLNFVQNLEYYMMFEVLEPRFHVFLEKVHTKVNSVDDMIKEHTSFYEGISRDCMLTQKNSLHYIVKILQLCVDFARYIQRNHQLAKQSQETIKFNVIIEENEECEHSFSEKIKCMHHEFHYNLQKLLNEIINQQSDSLAGSMLSILYRLDFNEFYAKVNDGYGKQ